MATENSQIDENREHSLLGVSNDANLETRNLRVDPTSNALLVDIGGVTGLNIEGDVAHDAVDSGNPVKIGGKAVDPTSMPAAVALLDRVDGSFDDQGRQVIYDGMQLDVTNDSVSTQPIEPTNVNTAALAASLVIKNSAGSGYVIRGHNDLASAQYIQVHDAASLPADTAVPEDVIIVAADSNFEIIYPQSKAFATGIVVCNSSTLATKTIGSADCWFSAESL